MQYIMLNLHLQTTTGMGIMVSWPSYLPYNILSFLFKISMSHVPNYSFLADPELETTCNECNPKS